MVAIVLLGDTRTCLIADYVYIFMNTAHVVIADIFVHDCYLREAEPYNVDSKRTIH